VTLLERVERVLDGYQVARADVFEHGYRAMPVRAGGVIVEWGHGDPFIPRAFLPEGLKRCTELLVSGGFEVLPAEDGLAILVQGLSVVTEQKITVGARAEA